MVVGQARNKPWHLSGKPTQARSRSEIQAVVALAVRARDCKNSRLRCCARTSSRTVPTLFAAFVNESLKFIWLASYRYCRNTQVERRTLFDDVSDEELEQLEQLERYLAASRAQPVHEING
jgi:hypothetical protein